MPEDVQVLTTVDSEDESGRSIVGARLAACVQIVGRGAKEQSTPDASGAIPRDSE
jgi:uncharacterized protein involved in tolerance to divalent cations